MIIKPYFWAHFVQKETKRSFPIFDQNHGLTPLKKKRSNMASFVKFAFYCLEGFVSYFGEYQALFLGLICPKPNLDEVSNFGPKIMG